MAINIADFGRNNLMDVGSLRRLADQMERNEEPMAEHVIVVCETQDGELKCYGYPAVASSGDNLITFRTADIARLLVAVAPRQSYPEQLML